MTIERLRDILEYSNAHTRDIEDDVKDFCRQIDLHNLDEVRNVLQFVKPYLSGKKYLIIQLPLADNEIGAFVYKGDALSYLVINTSMPVLNTHFALCHELHHIFFPSDETVHKARIDLGYYSNENEMRANIFAGNLLMPEGEFRRIFLKLKQIYERTDEEDNTNELGTIISLMDYFKAPFMAVYIRCYELGLLTGTPRYLDISPETVQSEFEKLWLDTKDLKPSRIDNSEYLIKRVNDKGAEYLEKGYINERTLHEVQKNIATLFSKVKAGA